ncbi:MAG: hypothetical protein H3C47_16550, partial [Candidatus Cloacimonetes bacterium]|nr:hypothetical protein [Candidatus Cloacimonadota bacterium]
SQIAFFEKPYLRFERMLKTWLKSGIRSWPSLRDNLPLWINHRLPPNKIISQKISEATGWDPLLVRKKLMFYAHHQSHAASAFFASPFSEAGILIMDGVGEWSTTTIWKGENNQIKPLLEMKFPDSLGLFYSAFTGYLGFRILSGEYKLMGLAAYGKPRFVDLLKKHIIHIDPNGGIRLNTRYLNFLHPAQAVTKAFSEVLGFGPKSPEQELLNEHKDLAASVQTILEEVIIKLVDTTKKVTGSQNLCLAGGVALNCRANGRVLNEFPDLNLFVQPASSDSGGSLGAACLAQISQAGDGKNSAPYRISMDSCYFGPELLDEDIKKALDKFGLKKLRLEDHDLINTVQEFLSKDQIVAWARGRMEFGPRALGARSILANPCSETIKDKINSHIKQREGFRPFAPIVCEEDASKYFDLNCKSPHMLLAVKVMNRFLPAITHIDDTARVQTLRQTDNPLLHKLLKLFEKKVGFSVLLNTSFNLRGEPIAASAQDCIKSFLMCRLDALVLGNYLILRSELSESMLNYQSNDIEAD